MKLYLLPTLKEALKGTVNLEPPPTPAPAPSSAQQDPMSWAVCMMGKAQTHIFDMHACLGRGMSICMHARHSRQDRSRGTSVIVLAIHIAIVTRVPTDATSSAATMYVRGFALTTPSRL